jgi:DNA-binding PadR family transcriptional regulator
MGLSQKTFFVLLALRDAPLHGYAIRTTVLELSDGAFELEPGGLYRLLQRLQEDGLIGPSRPPREADSDDPRRRYYSLTREGHRALKSEAGRLARLVARPEVAALATEP